IDFSLPEGFDPVLALCAARGAAFVSGTTGISDGQRGALRKASQAIPVLWASNFSLGVAVLEELVERSAAALAGWDCDIVESHHTQKQDAPSGTALSLGEAAGRGGAQPRYASLRAGDIVGEHLVQFTAMGERIELVHRATNRDIFARGALHAAGRLAGRGPGLYRVRDLLCPRDSGAPRGATCPGNAIQATSEWQRASRYPFSSGNVSVWRERTRPGIILARLIPHSSGPVQNRTGGFLQPHVGEASDPNRNPRPRRRHRVRGRFRGR